MIYKKNCECCNWGVETFTITKTNLNRNDPFEEEWAPLRVFEVCYEAQFLIKKVAQRDDLKCIWT